MRIYSVLALTAFLSSNLLAQSPPSIAWKSWSDDNFVQAKKEHKFILLDLEAVWCHWCHVQDATTYQDPTVIKLIGEKYIAVKVDQDSRPDISNRYEDYGWPATVVFGEDGKEIVKRQGYIPPVGMAAMLQAIIDDPTPGPSIQATAPIRGGGPSLSADVRTELARRTAYTYDEKYGAWGTVQKFMDWDAVEYCMNLAAAGDASGEHMAKGTLAGQLNLIDPAWGGVYQYSTNGDWVHPHFEKIMQMQAENLRTYANAYAMWKDPTYLKAATDIHRFLTTFLLSPDGAFYTSMSADLPPDSDAKWIVTRRSDAEVAASGDDASGEKQNWVIRRYKHGIQQGTDRLTDDTEARYLFNDFDPNYTEADFTRAGSTLETTQGGVLYFCLGDADRRAMGMPRTDQNSYSRENGWVINALASLYAATGDAQALSEAKGAAQWIIANRSLPGGGFKHGDADPAGPYLGDTLSMARAFLNLYSVTGDRAWLTRASSAADFIIAHFTSPDAVGVATADLPSATGPFKPGPEADENVMAARFANLLSHYTGKPEYRKLAETAMRYVADPRVAESRNTMVSGFLLADAELTSEPLHVVIVGPKSDASAQALFATAAAFYKPYRRLEWYDAAEGPLPNADVEYPQLPRAAAFICTGSACSSPAFTVADLERKLTRAARH